MYFFLHKDKLKKLVIIILSWYFCSVNESKPHHITGSEYIPQKIFSYLFLPIFPLKRRRFNHFSLSLFQTLSHTQSSSCSKAKKQCPCRCSSHASQAQRFPSPSNAPFWCAALRRSSPTWRW